jgi:hypothetical protein
MKRNTNKGLEQDGRLQPAQVTDAWTLSSQKVQVLSELDWTGTKTLSGSTREDRFLSVDGQRA